MYQSVMCSAIISRMDSKSLRTGGALLVSGQALQALAAFGVNLVLVRFLMPEDFGRFALILAGASLTYGAVSLRINVLVIRSSEARFDQMARERYFTALFLETVIATFIVVAWLAVFTSATVLEIGLVLAIGVRNWTEHNKAFYERSMPYKRLAALETGVAISAHIVALFLVINIGGVAVLILREIFLTAAGLAGLWMIGGLTMMKVRWLSWAEFKQIFQEAKGIWLDGVLEGSFQQLTIILAGLLGGERIAGLFFQAQRLAVVPHQILAPIAGRIAPNWLGRTEDPKRRIAGRDRLLLGLSVPLLVVGMATVLFADPIVPWLFGAKWANSAPLLAAMAGMVVFLSLFEILKTYCWTTQQVPILLRGRLAQYAGLIGMMAFSLPGWLQTDMALAAGLSVSYISAFAVLLFSLKFYERRRSY